MFNQQLPNLASRRDRCDYSRRVCVTGAKLDVRVCHDLTRRDASMLYSPHDFCAHPAADS